MLLVLPSHMQVRQLVIRGTFHAGGFFAPGHLARAHSCMPHITRLMFVKCRDLKPERLREVVDSKLSPYIELVEGSNFGPNEQQQQQQEAGGVDAELYECSSSSSSRW